MFHRVEPRHAGLTALGILVPHGENVPVIARPRGLEWDLLPARWDGKPAHAPQFCAWPRAEAALEARRFFQALETCAAAGTSPLQTSGDRTGRIFQIWLRAEAFVWIACRRAPGQAYQPANFATLEEAQLAAARIAAVVCPAAGVQQEYYFNTQNFS